MMLRLDSVAWITSLIAAAIAIVITTGIPAWYFAISYQYMLGSMDAQAELAARTAERLVMANPKTWRFEEIRLQELLQRQHDQTIPELRSIIDSSGEVIAHMTNSPAKPLAVRRHDIYDAGDVVGHVEISRSLRPLLFRTGLVGAISFLIGACIFLVLRIIPLRAVRAEQLRAQRLEIQNRQLQKAESLGLMAGAVAHLFNNELQAIMGNLELALLDLPSGSNGVENLTEAVDACRRAAEVSGLMLTYQGQTSGEHELLDLSQTCQSSLPMIGAVVPKNVSMQIDFLTPGPTVRANANQIHQILINLVNNSVESIGEHSGTIRLAVKTVAAAEIPASHRFPIDWKPRSVAYVCMEVEDSGCGIVEEDIEKIFDPFFTTKFTGRGLGLSVIVGIIRAYDGVIVVESEPGRGSAFRVYLPKSTETIPRKVESKIPAAKLEDGGTVLLIEDELMVRNVARVMLARLGFEVLEAKNGAEGVQLFKLHQNRIRCVLSDLTMPHMDGWDTLAALRRISPDIPVILSSGYDEARVMEGEHSVRPNAFLSKPYRLKGLRETINRVLS
ncbi:MAG: ATP-binding protein [Desulforhabdus sp.]|jgi:signal transduction histidine kinase|nr:ATP-binding protein [Desulforhabdus sp.]